MGFELQHRLVRIVLFTFGLCLAPGSLFPQTGSLRLVQDPRVDELVNRHIALNKRQSGVTQGFRVQIYFNSGNESKKGAIETRSAFLARFPEIPAYLSFQEPFFKVRVGDYRNRVEAHGLLQLILPDYPNAFVVRDRIHYPRIHVP